MSGGEFALMLALVLVVAVSAALALDLLIRFTGDEPGSRPRR